MDRLAQNQVLFGIFKEKIILLNMAKGCRLILLMLGSIMVAVVTKQCSSIGQNVYPFVLVQFSKEVVLQFHSRMCLFTCLSALSCASPSPVTFEPVDQFQKNLTDNRRSSRY